MLGVKNSKLFCCLEGEKPSATIIEQSSINYTLLHLTWLYDQEDDLRMN